MLSGTDRRLTLNLKNLGMGLLQGTVSCGETAWLAVGDAAFQRRSLERIQSLMHEGATVVLVSHDLRQVAEWASQVLWLDGGRAVMIADPSETVAAYADGSVVATP